MKHITAFLVLLLLVTCTTYDSAIVYHKNFRPGTHPLLRFSGYYDDTARPPATVALPYLPPPAKPVFFYAEGSCFSTDNYVIAHNYVPELIRTNRLFGSWGNYLIKGDSITLEKFQEIK